jgi:hypothetical protein
MLVLGQRAVGTTATFICTLPPGPSRLTLVTGTASSVFLGAVTPGLGSAPGLTTTTGAQVLPSSSVVYDQRPGCSGVDIYGIGTATTTASYHITTDG